jgi:hypothetical protein
VPEAKVVQIVNIFEDSMNPAHNKFQIDASSFENEHEVRSVDENGDQKFFLTAAAIAE